MNLARALRFRMGGSAAVAGAGGKTTAVFQLARELPAPVVVSATAHLHIDQVRLADTHLVATTPDQIAQADKNLHGVILVTGPVTGDRAMGLNPETIHQLKVFCKSHSLPLLIEADGSRRHPLKAPAAHEPPIPGFVELVVITAGLSGLGKPLTDENVYNPEAFSRLSGVDPGGRITGEAIARVLLHPEGGLKNIPAGARRVVLLNQADTPALQAQGQQLAEKLLPAYQAVIVAELKESKIHSTFERSAGIILAAGEASRFGSPKQLQEYHDRPFVRNVAEAALAGGLSPVVVVTGAYADQVKAVVSDLKVDVVLNERWREGQSSSIQAGLRSLPAETGAAIFLLADQPQIKATIIRALVERHARELAAIIAPLVQDRRGNPVLFDQVTFPDLLTLKGDSGGRTIFSKHPVDYLPWHDDSVLIDIDTAGDLKKLGDQ